MNIANNINYLLNNYYLFILSGLLIMIISFFTLRFLVKRSSVKDNRIKILGLFINLNNNQIISLSLLTVRYIFIIYFLLSHHNNITYLYFLIIITLLYNIFNKKTFFFIFDILNSLLYYFGIYIFNLVYEYNFLISSSWYLSVIILLSGLFIFMYATYFFVLNVDDVLLKDSKNKVKKNVKKKKVKA